VGVYHLTSVIVTHNNVIPIATVVRRCANPNPRKGHTRLWIRPRWSHVTHNRGQSTTDSSACALGTCACTSIATACACSIVLGHIDPIEPDHIPPADSRQLLRVFPPVQTYPGAAPQRERRVRHQQFRRGTSTGGCCGCCRAGAGVNVQVVGR